MLRGTRAQSEVIGVVLLLGMSMIVIGSTVAIGSVALSDSQSTAELGQAEAAMTQVDSKASLVAHGESDRQHVSLGAAETSDLRVEEDVGRMEIEVTAVDGSGNEIPGESESRTVTLGAVVYEHRGETIAYQGGGVWRDDGTNVRMVSPPEFHYRDATSTETLTLPLVTIAAGDEGVHDGLAIEKDGSEPERLFPNGNVSNPLVDKEVTITVTSDYAEAWATYFESRTRATVVETTENTVEVTLRTELEHPTLDAAISSTGQSRMEFGGIHTLEADSYDSSNGTYDPETAGEEVVVQSNDEIHLTAGGGGDTENITINGDLVAEGYQIPSGQEEKLTVTGEKIEIDDFAELDPVSGAIRQRIDAVVDRRIDENGTTIDGGLSVGSEDVEPVDEDTYVDGDVEVTDGTLAVGNGVTLHVAGDVVVDGDGAIDVDDLDGTVDVLVEGDLTMRDDATLEAAGEEDTNVFVDGSIALADDATVRSAEGARLQIHNTGDVSIDDRVSVAAEEDLAADLWLYSSGDSITFDGDAEDPDGVGIEFVGVFYAPESDAELRDDMTIKGSFTFGEFTFEGADLRFHYDEALAGEQPFEGEEVPVVSYLHVSEHRVVIGDD